MANAHINKVDGDKPWMLNTAHSCKWLDIHRDTLHARARYGSGVKSGRETLRDIRDMINADVDASLNQELDYETEKARKIRAERYRAELAYDKAVAHHVGREIWKTLFPLFMGNITDATSSVIDEIRTAWPEMPDSVENDLSKQTDRLQKLIEGLKPCESRGN